MLVTTGAVLGDACERAAEMPEESCPSPFSRQGSISLYRATFF